MSASQQMGERMKETWHDMGAACGSEQLTHSIEEHPMTAAAVSLGIGLATGVCLGIFLAASGPSRSRRETYTQRFLDSLGEHLPDRLAQRLGV